MDNTTLQLLLKFPECITFASVTKDENTRNVASAVICACLIPLIIGANLLLILGIIKTKKAKFTSSQILFLILFLSDMTISVVQLPVQIYLNLKSSYPSCFELQLATFFTTFPICMSGTILCVASVDRYTNVVYKRSTTIAANKSLIAIIILATLISFIWAIVDIQLKGKLEIKAVAQFYVILSAYTEAVIAIGVVFNINVKQKTQNSSLQQSLDSSLTKTIAM